MLRELWFSYGTKETTWTWQGEASGPQCCSPQAPIGQQEPGHKERESRGPLTSILEISAGGVRAPRKVRGLGEAGRRLHSLAWLWKDAAHHPPASPSVRQWLTSGLVSSSVCYQLN